MATWNLGWSTTLLDRRASRAMTWAGMSRHQMIDRVAIVSASPTPGSWRAQAWPPRCEEVVLRANPRPLVAWNARTVACRPRPCQRHASDATAWQAPKIHALGKARG